MDRRKFIKTLGAGTAALAASRGFISSQAEAAAFRSRQGTSAGRNKTISEHIAEFVVNARFEDLPPAVVAKAKALVVYHFGVAFAGSFSDQADQLRKVAPLMGQTESGATVIGESFRLQPLDAVFANTTLMHALFRDDVFFPSGIHPAVVTLPTALAIGEVKGLSGRELILAMVLGYEVLAKLGNAAWGWGSPMPRSPTMIYGGFGPVTVAGRLLGLDQECMTHAIAMGASLGQGVNGGGATDHLYSYISRNGTMAALFAEAGGSARDKNTIEGKLGLYESFFGEVPTKLDSLVGSLGSDWDTLRAEYKPYHGTGSNNVAVRLLQDLAREHKLAIDEVAKIEVFAPMSRKGRKANAFNGPFKTPEQAYRSLPYALSVALLDGNVDSHRYTETAIQNKTLTAMARNITLIYEDGHDVAAYRRLEVYTKDGHKLVRAGDRFRFPFPPSDWGPWLRKDGKRLLSLEQLQRLEQLISKLEDVDDVAKLMDTLAPNRG